MLEELVIRDFALIEKITVPFTSGFNVLTGETGAGKSILIDALNAVLGGRVGPANIRAGAERALIEATFKQTPCVAGWLKQQELQSDDGCLIVAREITKSGSRLRVNGTLVNQAIVQELKQKLFTVHAQHESRTLISAQSQLDMVDGLGASAHKKAQEKVRTLFARHKELCDELQELSVSEDERERRLDFARFQWNEIVEAQLLDPDEDERVARDLKILANVAQLEDLAQKAQDRLAGSDTAGVSAIDLVQEALYETENGSRLDASLASICDTLREAADALEAGARALRKYKEGLDVDPETLSSLEARHAQLATVKRKYGPLLAQAITRREELALEIEKLDNASQAASTLEAELAGVRGEFDQAAADLSSRRKAVASKLAASIQEELVDLGMERCRFEIAFESIDVGAQGCDRVEFMIAPNPGQPLSSVAKIASGGELSRVMLAIKSIVADADQVATVVFDEIDTGLSGRVLQSMRDKLARLANSHQILCITHQPIIASVAFNHIQVTKTQSETKTSVSVSVLSEAERVKAMAGMASGQDDQEVALSFARSLFEEGSRLRNS